MKSTKVETAIGSFKDGLNCAQAVIFSYSDVFNYDPNLALHISCGFGGGMGRLQETCGAVTGAFMVLGIYNCQKHSDDKYRKEETCEMIREFSEKFKSVHGTTSCKLLLNCDLNTEEGRCFRKENKLNETVCETCISDSVKILQDLIKKREALCW